MAGSGAEGDVEGGIEEISEEIVSEAGGGLRLRCGVDVFVLMGRCGSSASRCGDASLSAWMSGFISVMNRKRSNAYRSPPRIARCFLLR